MKNRPLGYLESHKINVNTFLLFYLSVTIIMIIANILPLSPFNYMFSFVAGLMAICLLFIKAIYKITIKDELLKISIKIFVEIVLLKIDLGQVAKVEEITTSENSSLLIINFKGSENICYIPEIPTEIKLTTLSNKVYRFSTRNANQLIDIINLGAS